MVEMSSTDSILIPDDNRFVMFPIQHDDIWSFYKKSEANFTIYFSDRYEYSSKEEVPLKYLMNNFGFFWVYWSARNVIYKGSMYVDISRVKSDECKKHLLREELTQSLGMMNDIDKDGSIFNQNWECTTNYLDFDRKIIRKFLNK